MDAQQAAVFFFQKCMEFLRIYADGYREFSQDPITIIPESARKSKLQAANLRR